MIDWICRSVERVNVVLGRTVMWLALAMVLVQFSTVVMRYVFGIGSLMLYESIVYMHGILFTTAAAHTLANDGHVRVDIFYGSASPRRQALINLIGVLVFLLPVCGLAVWLGWPYVMRSWAVLEGSRETSGIPGIFVLKTFILVFGVTLFAQGVVLALRSALIVAGAGSGPADGQPGDSGGPGENRATSHS